jgi:hypothetical protein
MAGRINERTWINPSPNAPNLWMARAYAGTVMLEGATLSEGRGTTRPLELFGAPDIDARRGDRRDAPPRPAMAAKAACCATAGSNRPSTSTWASSAAACRSTPRTRTYDHAAFRPWRVQALAFKAIRNLYPGLRRSGAISRTSTNSANWPSTSSTAARCCANGSTIRERHARPTSTRSPAPTTAQARQPAPRPR